MDISVAAILRAMRPDLPTPDTITLPFTLARMWTARAKLSSRRLAAAAIDSASDVRTRRPRSTAPSGYTADRLREVPLENASPFSSCAQQRFHDFPDRPM